MEHTPYLIHLKRNAPFLPIAEARGLLALLDDFGWGGMLLMLVGTLLFLALLALLIWAVLRFVTGKTATPVPPYRSNEPIDPSA